MIEDRTSNAQNYQGNLNVNPGSSHKPTLNPGGTSIRYPPVTTITNFMTYQSLSHELEQEKSSLEDLHMFFVAFYRRQRKIVEAADALERGAGEGDEAF